MSNNKIKPFIETYYADNGALSHYGLIDENTGERLCDQETQDDLRHTNEQMELTIGKLKARIEDLEKEKEWISVEERVPDLPMLNGHSSEACNVIVMMHDLVPIVYHAHYMKVPNEDEFEWVNSNNRVIHPVLWRFVPQPPSKQKK